MLSFAVIQIDLVSFLKFFHFISFELPLFRWLVEIFILFCHDVYIALTRKHLYSYTFFAIEPNLKICQHKISHRKKIRIAAKSSVVIYHVI